MDIIWLIFLFAVVVINGQKINKTLSTVRNCNNNIYTHFNNKNVKSVIDTTGAITISGNKSANISSVNRINLDYYTKRENNKSLSIDLKRYSYEEDLLKTLSQKVLSLSKPFDSSASLLVSSKCRLHSKFYLKSLNDFKLWALKMHDSSAKISSGILNGNVNYLGDFDQCINVKEDDYGIYGKYCLTYLQTSVADNLPKHRHLHTLMQSHSAFKSDFDDPGHRVPRFSIINWAVCVPSSCTPNDVESSLKEYIQNFTAGTAFDVKVRVDPLMCQVKNTAPYDRNTILAGIFFLAFIALSLTSTWIEYRFQNPNQWLIAFSLYKNALFLIDMERSPSDIESVHGIRFLNAVLLILSHKSMALFFDPYINRTEMAQSLGQPWTVIGRAAAIYTDVFLMFSGLLTSYSMIGKLKQKKPLNLIQEYVGRFIRIVPTFGALILFCTYILPNLGTGPQWNLVVTQHATKCKQYWWRNLLFIHNYFGFEEMCLTHTHHLGIDTELFIVAPIMILILWKWPKKGLLLLLTLAGMSTIGRYYVTVVHKLSNYVYFGTSIQSLFRTADYMYIIPAHRATIYILGILLGYALRIYKDYKLTQTQLKMGWCISWMLFVAVFFGPAPMGSMSYVYNKYHAAIYAALGPMAWCALFAWIIFTSHLGYESLLSRLLSWKGFLITTRLSYAIYLTQFPVFFFNVGRRRHAKFYEFIADTVNIHEYIWIGITAIALTLLFDTPFQNIKKILFKSKSSETQSSQKIINNINSNTNNLVTMDKTDKKIL